MAAPISPTTQKHVRQMIKDFRKSCKQFIIFLLINLIIIIVFSLLFFYIEHCYDPITPPDPLQPYVDVCRYIQNNATYTQNDTQLAALCKQALNYKPTVIECTLNKKNFFKYYDYYVSVAYTLGYGRVVPYSDTGKIVTIVCSIPTIVMVMTSYIFAGKIITALVKLLVLLIRKKCFGIRHSRKFTLQCFILQFVLTILLWLCLSTVDNSVYKGRRYLDSMYFAMATISTVGFGDFSWSSEDCFDAGFHYLVLSSMVFLFSMGVFASSITTIYEMFLEFSHVESIDGEPENFETDYKSTEQVALKGTNKPKRDFSYDNIGSSEEKDSIL